MIATISDAYARAIGEGLLDKTWPAAKWRHTEHCIATLYLVKERHELRLATALPGIIQMFNLAHGTQNTATTGYHHTITLFYLSEIQKFAQGTNELPLGRACEALLSSKIADKDYLFRFWSHDRIMCPAARLAFVAPDLTDADWSPEVSAILPPSV